jgi:putative drug exporter of the RND superfamily
MRRLADFVVRWPWVVIGAWIAIAVALPLLFPSLNEMSEKHPLAILPSDAPSAVTARKMTEAFHEAGSEDLLLVVLTDDKGLSPADETTYRNLADTLRKDTKNVVMLQDFISTPPLKSIVTSKDNKAWVLPVGVAGELGTPRSYEAFNQITSVVNHAVAGTSLRANLTGPAGAITMLLPLITIALSLVIAQGVVAAYSFLTSAGVSNQSIVFLSAIMAGAGTDYAVFLISRYHDYLRLGESQETALKKALISIARSSPRLPAPSASRSW